MMRNSPMDLSGLALALLLAGLVCTGCSENTSQPAHAPQLDAQSVKSRSLEIQAEIEQLIPKEITTNNDLNGPNEDYAFTLLHCRPLFAAEDSRTQESSDSVQYPGSFSVRLDEAVEARPVVDELYRAIIESPDFDLNRELLPEHATAMTTLYTTDGYAIRLSYVLPSDSERYLVNVDVWSPCFIPETMPPGG